MESSEPTVPVRRAGVTGKPVRHSLSPVLHRAAYRALGLTGWRYDAHETDEGQLRDFVRHLGPEWAGLSVTMPGKRVALEIADEVTARAGAVGAANTLVPLGDGRWRADCTDVDGVGGALRAAGGPAPLSPDAGTAVVLGAGGTAAAAAVALAGFGFGGLRLVVREPARAVDTVAAARKAGLAVSVCRWAETDFDAVVADASVLVSTVPSDAVAGQLAALASVPSVLDVIYDPWPTPLARAVAEAGGRAATGLDMLLHQSFGQVEQFTGLPAPQEEMRDALGEATGHPLPLPSS